MVSHFRASERLGRIRISRRCYTLLNQARIRPEHIRNFYVTYRLPDNPFFPLFFAIKRDYLAERERIREERRRYILSAMRSLPPPVLTTVKYLGYLERHYNAAGRSPVWQKHLFPGSKKKADAYSRYDTRQWLALFRDHLSLLEQRYRGLNELVAERVFACIVLELTPDLIPPARPSQSIVSRHYRRLSMLYHPDRGGDPTMFIEIKRARDVLVGSGSR